MKPTLFLIALTVASLVAEVPNAFSQGTAFTYQGRLNHGANIANGSYDFRFALYDDATGGTTQGLILTKVDVPVSDGLFTVEVDFGNQFPGASRWLELYVRTNGGGSYTLLTPRQSLTPTPYAVYSLAATTAGSANAVPGLAFNTNRSALALGTGNTANSDYSTVSGGTANTAIGQYATVSGGYYNTASGDRSVVSGGYGNQAIGYVAFLGSGLGNQAGGNYSAVVGGDNNFSSGGSSFVGGGAANQATNLAATVPGGVNNLAGGEYSFAAGQRAKALHDGAFVWADSTNADFASTAPNQFLIRASGGVGINTNNPNGAALAVNGNLATTGDIVNPLWSVTAVTDPNFGPTANIKGGYSGNIISNGVVGGFIGGGGLAGIPNVVASNYASVLGGYDNTASGLAASAMGRSTTASGADSTAMGYSARASGASSTAMGYRTSASGDFSTAMGSRTVASGNYSTAIGFQSQANGITSIALGVAAKAAHNNSFVWSDGSAGVFTSTAAEQFLISAAGGVGIGTAAPQASLHVASSATWPKAQLLLTQTANDYARLQMGVGTNSKWMFAVQPAAAPNLEFYLGASKLAELTPAGAMFAQSFNPTSDRNAKENFDPVSPQEVLEKVAGLTISRWNFKEDKATPHVGPMAQDFHAAFGLGTDDKHIATVDADGVALAAIQGLNQKVDSENASLRAENAELKARLERLEQLMMQNAK